MQSWNRPAAQAKTQVVGTRGILATSAGILPMRLLIPSSSCWILGQRRESFLLQGGMEESAPAGVRRDSKWTSREDGGLCNQELLDSELLELVLGPALCSWHAGRGRVQARMEIRGLFVSSRTSCSKVKNEKVPSSAQ